MISAGKRESFKRTKFEYLQIIQYQNQQRINTSSCNLEMSKNHSKHICILCKLQNYKMHINIFSNVFHKSCCFVIPAFWCTTVICEACFERDLSGIGWCCGALTYNVRSEWRHRAELELFVRGECVRTPLGDRIWDLITGFKLLFVYMENCSQISVIAQIDWSLRSNWWHKNNAMDIIPTNSYLMEYRVD